MKTLKNLKLMPTGDYLFTDGERTYTINEIFDMVEKDLEILGLIKRIYKNLILNDVEEVIALYNRKECIYKTIGEVKYISIKSLENAYNQSLKLKEWLEND